MVISLSDFNKLSEKDQKKTLENLKQEIGVSGIVKAWEISRSKAYSMLREFNILVNSRKPTVKPKNQTILLRLKTQHQLKYRQTIILRLPLI